MTEQKDLISVTEARELLGVSRQKMANLISTGMLRHYPDPLDLRSKLVRRTEVLSLKKRDKAA
jgi:predicted DNA-binding transcriptional regulator AlpA